MRILKEILWLGFAAIFVVIVIFPITSVIDYKYLTVNVLVIVLAVFYSKTNIEFNTYTIFNNKWMRLGMFAVNLFILVIIIAKIQKNLIYFDAFTISAYSDSVVIISPTKESSLIKYINSEFLAFGIITLVGLVSLNIKLIKSLWGKPSIKDY